MAQRVLKLALSLAAFIWTTTAVDAAGQGPYKWSHYAPIDSIVDQTSKAIVKEIAEKTNGRIKINIFPAGQLGDWMEVTEQVMRGSVDFALQPVSPSYDKRLQVRVLPYSVMNYDEAKSAYFGNDPYLFDIMAKLMEAGGLKALAAVAEGFGGGGFRDVPSVDVLDAAANKGGLKMRFPPGNQAWQSLVSAFGFNPTPVPWGELYMAMQTKLVDAQVGGQPYSTWSSFRDVTKCWVQYNTHFQNSFVFVNNDLWKKFSNEDQQIIQQAAFHHAQDSLEKARAEDAKYMDMMAKAGTKVIVPSDEALAKIAAAARKKVWPSMEQIIGNEILDLMRKKAGIQ